LDPATSPPPSPPASPARNPSFPSDGRGQAPRRRGAVPTGGAHTGHRSALDDAPGLLRPPRRLPLLPRRADTLPRRPRVRHPCIPSVPVHISNSYPMVIVGIIHFQIQDAESQ